MPGQSQSHDPDLRHLSYKLHIFTSQMFKYTEKHNIEGQNLKGNSTIKLTLTCGRVT